MSWLPPWTPFNKPFQPVPDITYSRLLEGRDNETAKRLKCVQQDLEEYADRMEHIASALDTKTVRRYQTSATRELRNLADELNRCLQISSLRAKHRALILRAVLTRGEGPHCSATSEGLLTQAAFVRQEALSRVRLQEHIYRYTAEQLAQQS